MNRSHKSSRWHLRTRITRWIVVSLAVACASAASEVVAQNVGQPPRIGLVIANSSYQNSKDQLYGPDNDAEKIRNALLELHFVGVNESAPTIVINADQQKLKDTFNRFKNALEKAGPLAIGFVYYAGHAGANSVGRMKDNYLLPVDVDDIATVDVEKRGVGVRWITERFQNIKPARPAIVIVVDACRTPTGRATTQRGATDDAAVDAYIGPRIVAPEEPKPGFLVAFSTSEGQSASDSGVYADVLAEKLKTEGLSITQVFEHVIQDVARKTGQRQIPFHRAKITAKDLCLIACAGSTQVEGLASFVIVPDVVGKTAEQAKEMLYGKNIALEAKVSEVATSDPVPPGLVQEQEPRAGTRIDPRSTIVHLLVSDGPRDPDAQFTLGQKYNQGVGVGRDDVNAAHWYNKAAEQGHALAQYNLGHLYFSGKGVANDPKMVFRYWSMAADQGNPQAQHSLGMLYIHGYGGVKDRQQGIAWLKKAAAQGLDKSKEALGLVELEDAADGGNAKAKYQLAGMYLQGRNVTPNLQSAIALYRSSADQGYAPAQFNMGNFYEEGKGVPRSLIKAFEWYKNAAERGHASAQNNLGRLYMKGEAVSQDFVLAIVWFNVAAAQGVDDARTNLNLSKQLRLSSSDVKRINDLSREYYQRYVVKEK